MRNWRRKFCSAARGAALLSAGLALSAPRARAEDSNAPADYRFTVPAALALGLDSPGELVMRLLPAEGYRVSRKGPLRIDLRAERAEELRIKKPRLTLADVSNPESSAPTFRAKLQASKAGSQTLLVVLHFWLCRRALCRPVRSESQVQVTARAADEPTGPDAGAPSASAERAERN